MRWGSSSIILGMSRKLKSYILPGLIIIVAAAILGLGLPHWFAEIYANSKRYTADDVPAVRVAIVFGAGLQRDGSPSPILRDRIETAAKLYATGKVEKLLMSGDNRFVDYNEPGAMRAYALRLGIPAKDIVLDYAGRRTYDTCYRARHIFDIQSAILVTQNYHLPRALLTCNNLGIQASGVAADMRRYPLKSWVYWYLREIPATSVALWEVWVSHPLPVLGEPELIFIPIPVNTILAYSSF